MGMDPSPRTTPLSRHACQIFRAVLKEGFHCSEEDYNLPAQHLNIITVKAAALQRQVLQNTALKNKRFEK